jgi:hypothetical protein
MNKQEAEEIARHYLAPRFGSLEVVILPKYTLEKEYGWIFHYQRRDYLEGRSKHGLIGNGPVLVEKSGNIVRFPSSIPVEESIRRYELGEPLVPPRKSKVG